jgi:hypothetical protein
MRGNRRKSVVVKRRMGTDRKHVATRSHAHDVGCGSWARPREGRCDRALLADGALHLASRWLSTKLRGRERKPRKPRPTATHRRGRSGHEVEQGQDDDDLLVVRSTAARRGAYDLEHRGKLHRDVEWGAARQQT